MITTEQLKQVNLFINLSPAQYKLIASLCVEQSYSPGAVIIEANQPGQELYVIVTGEVEIQLAAPYHPEGWRTIARLGHGQSFGEIVLVDPGLRSAQVRAAESGTEVLMIDRDRLLKMCDMYPDMGYKLMRNLAHDLALKIRQTDVKLSEMLTWTHSPPQGGTAE